MPERHSLTAADRESFSEPEFTSTTSPTNFRQAEGYGSNASTSARGFGADQTRGNDEFLSTCIEGRPYPDDGSGSDGLFPGPTPNNPQGPLPSITRHLVSLLGDDVVLIGVPRGVKGPRHDGWQNTTIESMRNPAYVRELDDGRNLAVLTGAQSGGLCSIDLDNDEDVEPFLALNPELAMTLRSRGRRGCNLWLRVPSFHVYKRAP